MLWARVGFSGVGALGARGEATDLQDVSHGKFRVGSGGGTGLE